MIKKYKIGIMVYLFEVEGISYKTPHPSLGLTPMTQKCYMPVFGSIARYEFGKGASDMEVVNEDLDFPEDGSEDASPFELSYYEELSLI